MTAEEVHAAAEAVQLASGSRRLTMLLIGLTSETWQEKKQALLETINERQER